ncbi:WXG100-like domain-containing protein, partial [Saccharopolyspora phatthalungensis]
MVPEEVRRLFQVLTGEDMTDADEDALFAVAAALESGAATVESLAPVVVDVVGRVRGGFSGKAADRFAQRLDAFGPMLESGSVGLRELAEFVRNLALQVQYLKFVTVGGLLLLVAEIAWAVAMAGPTGGASMAWLAARFAVMRLLLTRWWGQLFMRLAMAQIVGIGLQVVMDAGAQGLQFALGTRKKWDAAMSEMAVGVGSFSGLLAVPLSALGNVVGNAITKVLVRGLGDKIDAEVLAAAARQVAEEHAEQYPVASMARFADVVAKNLEDYTGMSVRAMWVARFGHGLGESLEEGLTEMLGEAGYGAISGQGAQWNPFSFTAGVSEAIGSGIGNLAGLAVRGELIPAGRARDTGEKDSTSTDTDTDTAEESTTETGIQTSEKPGFAETVSEKPSPPKDMPDVQSRAPAPDSEKMATEPEKGSASVGSDVPLTSDILPAGSGIEKAPLGGGVSGARENGSIVKETAAGLSPSPDMPPDSPAHGASAPDTDAVVGQDSKASVREARNDNAPLSWHGGGAIAPAGLRGQDRPGTPSPPYSSPQADDLFGDSPGTDDAAREGGSRAAMPPAYSAVAGDVRADVASSGVDRAGEYRGNSLGSDSGATVGDSPSDSAHRDYYHAAETPQVDSQKAVDDVRVVEPQFQAGDSSTENSSNGAAEVSGQSSDVVTPGMRHPVAGPVAGTGGEAIVPGHGPVWDGPAVPGAFAGADSLAGDADVARLGDGARQWATPPESSGVVGSGGPGFGAGPVGMPADAARVSVPAEVVSNGGVVGFVLGRAADVGAPVVLVAGEDSGAPVVSSGQASRVAREVGRDVVALMPGSGRRDPRWMRFAPDGSRPRPVAGPGRTTTPQQAGEGRVGLDGVAKPSAAVPEGPVVAGPTEAGGAETASVDADSTATGAAESRMPSHAGEQPDSSSVAEWTESDLRREVERARSVGGPREAALEIVRGTHDVLALARGDAAVSLDDVVALVAVRVDAMGRAGAVRFSRKLADKLGTQGTGLDIRAGAGPDPHSEVPVSEESVGSEQVGGLSAESVDIPMAWGLDPTAAEWADGFGAWSFDPAAVEQTLGPGWDVLEPTVNAEGGGSEGVSGMDGERSRLVAELGELVAVLRRLLAGASQGYLPGLRGRVEHWSQTLARGGFDGVDVVALRKRVSDAGALVGRLRRDGLVDAAAGDGGVGVSEIGVIGGGSVDTGEAVVARVDAADRGVGAVGSVGEGESRKRGRSGDSSDEGAVRVRRSVGSGEAAVGPEPEAVDAAGVEDPALNEAGRAEARRARDAGQPYSQGALGKKFGKSKQWARRRLAEISGEGGASRSDLEERLREEGRAEARRARDAGQPYTSAALGEKFQKGAKWGLTRLAEVDREVGEGWATSAEGSRETVRVEANRGSDADDANRAEELGKKFGKGRTRGQARVAEIGGEDGESRSAKAERLREAGRAEARRALAEGKPHTGRTLAELFGKSMDWGKLRLVEVKGESGVSRLDLAERLREAARVEARRARDAGEFYSGAALGTKFGKSSDWGLRRLREVKNEVGSSAGNASDSGGDLATEDVASGRGMESIDPGPQADSPTLPELSDSGAAGRIAADSADEGWSWWPGWDVGAAAGVGGLDRGSGEHLNVAEIGLSGAADAAARGVGEMDLITLEAGFPGGAASGSAGGVSMGGGPSTNVASNEWSQTGVGSVDAAGWSESKLRVEVEWARLVNGSRDVAAGIVQGTHEVLALARGDAGVSLDDVVALVSVRVDEVGRDEAVRFSRELAARLGTQGTGLGIRAGAGPDPQPEVPALEESVAAEPADGLASGAFDPGVAAEFDPLDVGGWSRGEVAGVAPRGGVPGAGSDDAGLLGFSADVADRGAGELGSVGESSGRKRGREDGSVDEGAARRASGPQGFPVWPEFGGDSASWGVDDVPDAAALDPAASGGYLNPDELGFLGFGADPGLSDVLGGDSSIPEGAVPLSVEAEGAAVDPLLEAVDPAENVRSAGASKEAARSEARRARAAGEPYTGAALGKKFGKSTSWGSQRLVEIKVEDGEPRSDSKTQEGERLREAGRAEARRARDAGEPYTGVGLGKKFGKSQAWGRDRLAEIKAADGVTQRPFPEQEQEWEREQEAARAEARRARDAGEPYTGVALGKKFGKSKAWGWDRLAEIKAADGVTQRAVPEQEQEWEREREAGRVEARRARDAGEPYTGVGLGKKFGRSDTWGKSRLAEITAEDGAIQRVVREHERGWAREREAGRVEARRARNAGEPYSAAALGKKFGKSKAWGRDRLAEITAEGGATQRAVREQEREWEREREAGRVEARRARDAGEPYTGVGLGKKFGRSHAWGKSRLAEITAEDGAIQRVVPEQER